MTRYIPTYPGDWPEDFALDNGNYLHHCTDCDQPFIGYKRRYTCKPCAKKNEEWWATLTDEEKAAHDAKTLELAREIFAKALDKPAQV